MIYRCPSVSCDIVSRKLYIINLANVFESVYSALIEGQNNSSCSETKYQTKEKHRLSTFIIYDSTEDLL